MASKPVNAYHTVTTILIGLIVVQFTAMAADGVNDVLKEDNGDHIRPPLDSRLNDLSENINNVNIDSGKSGANVLAKTSKDSIPAADQKSAQTLDQTYSAGDIVLAQHPDCKDDIERLCGRMSAPLTNNLAVLSCIQNDRREEDIRLSNRCHHLMWSFKRNLTNDNRFASVAKRVCGRLIEQHSDCLKSESETAVLSPSANLLSCLIDRLEPDTDLECKSFLVKMEIIIFSDYRLVHPFTDHCAADIEKLKCGRLAPMTASPESHTQGQTIDCLEKSAEKLSPDCQHQILRIAELQSDDFHLDRVLYFACRDDRERFCPRVQSGEGRVYRCLMRHKLEHELSRECREKLFQREMLAVRDYKVAPGLAKACRNDIRAYRCRDQTSNQKEIRLAQILLCLEDALSKNYPVADDCRSEMLTHRRNLLDNYNLTPDLVSACDSDIQEFCNKLETGGKTLHCLMANAKRSRRRGAKRDHITESCRRALEDLLKEANVAEDWRVDPVLQQSCQQSVEYYCHDIQPGDGRVMSCLMDHIDAQHLGDDCRDALFQIQYFVARNFHLDAQLYRSCHANAEEYCHAKPNWYTKPEDMDPERGPTVLACLYRYAYHPKESVRLSRQCLFDIRRVMRQRAISVELMPEIEEPCIEDMAKLCSDERHTRKGMETQCLQDNFEVLSRECRDAIGNFTEEEGEHLELNYPLFKACGKAVKEVCSDALERDIDEGDLVECLVLNKNKQGVKKYPKCRAAIEHYQLLALKDFRFSFKFKEVCKNDVLAHCRTVKTKYDVVVCLSTIVYNDTMAGRHKYRVSADCRSQLRVELLERAESIKMDPILAKACEVDMASVCADVSPGEAQVIECFKTNIHRLTKACQRILFKRERIEMADNSIDYALLTSCRPAIAKYCKAVELSEVLSCLRESRDKSGMDQRCRSIVMKRLVEQNSDYRLNPRLKSACQRDIPKFCAEIIEKRRSKMSDDTQLEGEVIACLKRQYVLNKLSQMCELEIVTVMRESAASVELDSVLHKACEDEIRLKCDKEFDVRECLTSRFLSREIADDHCRREVARMVNEAKADIQSDPLLYKVCAQDLKHYCAEIPAGHGRQLSCLLAEAELTGTGERLSAECKTMLTKRVEMFEYAAQVAPVDSVADVVKQVAVSPSRNYFLFVLFSFVTFIFAGGLFCGRVTKRIAANDKIK